MAGRGRSTGTARRRPRTGRGGRRRPARPGPGGGVRRAGTAGGVPRRRPACRARSPGTGGPASRRTAGRARPASFVAVPTSTAAPCSCSTPAVSAARRVLPAPGSPPTSRTWPAPCAHALPDGLQDPELVAAAHEPGPARGDEPGGKATGLQRAIPGTVLRPTSRSIVRSDPLPARERGSVPVMTAGALAAHRLRQPRVKEL